MGVSVHVTGCFSRVGCCEIALLYVQTDDALVSVIQYQSHLNHLAVVSTMIEEVALDGCAKVSHVSLCGLPLCLELLYLLGDVCESDRLLFLLIEVDSDRLCQLIHIAVPARGERVITSMRGGHVWLIKSNPSLTPA